MIFRQNPDIIQSGQHDEIVLLNPESGQYLSLDGVGAFIWRLLDTDQDHLALTQVVEAVCQTYAVEAHTAKADVEQFTEALVQNGLLLTDQTT